MSISTVLRVGARIATGSSYAILGWDALRTPGGRVQMAGGTLDTIRKVLPLPKDDELLVRANAAVQTVGGVMLAAGILPRLSAVALASSLVPTTLAGHGFWAIDNPDAAKMQRVQFHKNVAMLGGLLFAANDAPRTRRDEATATHDGE